MKANLKGMVQPRFLDTLTFYLTMKHAKSKARNDGVAHRSGGKELRFLGELLADSNRLDTFSQRFGDCIFLRINTRKLSESVTN